MLRLRRHGQKGYKRGQWRFVYSEYSVTASRALSQWWNRTSFVLLQHLSGRLILLWRWDRIGVFWARSRCSHIMSRAPLLDSPPEQNTRALHDSEQGRFWDDFTT